MVFAHRPAACRASELSCLCKENFPEQFLTAGEGTCSLPGVTSVVARPVVLSDELALASQRTPAPQISREIGTGIPPRTASPGIYFPQKAIDLSETPCQEGIESSLVQDNKELALDAERGRRPRNESPWSPEPC